MWPNTGDSSLFLDTGTIARTTKDAALMLSVMAGHDRRDPMSIREPAPDYLNAIDDQPARLRMAWSPDLGRFKVEPEVRSITEAAARAFTDRGWSVDDATPKIEDPFDDIYMPIYLSDEYATLDYLLDERADELYPDTREELQKARTITREQQVKALNGLWRFQSQMADFFDDYEILLTPNNPVPAFPVNEPPPEIDGHPVEPYWTSFLPFLTVCNMTDSGGFRPLRLLGGRTTYRPPDRRQTGERRRRARCVRGLRRNETLGGQRPADRRPVRQLEESRACSALARAKIPVDFSGRTKRSRNRSTAESARTIPPDPLGKRRGRDSNPRPPNDR